jgi:hypothetical protein
MRSQPQKGVHLSVRTAVDSIVEEYADPISEDEGDLRILMDRHEDDVMRIMEQAIDAWCLNRQAFLRAGTRETSCTAVFDRAIR